MEYKITEILARELVSRKEPPKRKLGYIVVEGETALSYSRLKTLYTCPRKFQLKEISESGEHEPSVHTAFGSAFGAGVQELFRTHNCGRAILAATAAWDYPFLDDAWGKTKGKSLWHCIESLILFSQTTFLQLAAQYKLAELPIPAIETFVYISFGGRYNYQVHIDLILQHKVTAELTVAEIKTSGHMHHAAHWQNSLQTEGYFAVVAALAAKYGLRAAKAKIYITLQTNKLDSVLDNYGFHVFEFAPESNNSFNLTLLQDISTIEMYRSDGHFPKRGDACQNNYGTCQFFGICDKIPNKISLGNVYEPLTLEDAHVILTSEELICQ